MLLDVGHEAWEFPRKSLAPAEGVPRMPHQPVCVAIRLWELGNMESRLATSPASGARRCQEV